MMHSPARFPIPVMVSRWSRASAKGTITRSTSVSSVAMGLLEMFEALDRDPQHRGVMRTEPSAQRFAQHRDLLAERSA
jgi:hypothetical protein